MQNLQFFEKGYNKMEEKTVVQEPEKTKVRESEFILTGLDAAETRFKELLDRLRDRLSDVCEELNPDEKKDEERGRKVKGVLFKKLECKVFELNGVADGFEDVIKRIVL